MKRGKPIAACVANIDDKSGKRRKLSADNRESGDALSRSLPEYSRHTQEVDHFAFLPNEVINDIVAIAAEYHRSCEVDLTCQGSLAKLNGPWSAFAKNNTKVMLYHDGLALQSSDLMDKALSFDEANARNQSICFCSIEKNSDFEMIRQLAPKFYERVCILGSPDIPNDVLEILGDRFSHVTWRGDNTQRRCVRQTTNTTAIDFLKRQLRSKWLRSFTVDSVDLREQEFVELLVEFVKKPTFELLRCDDEDYISPEFFIEVDKAWQAKERFDVGYQKVQSRFTCKTTKKLKEHFNIPSRRKTIELVGEHSIQNSAKRIVTMEWESANSFSFELKFCNLEREID